MNKKLFTLSTLSLLLSLTGCNGNKSNTASNGSNGSNSQQDVSKVSPVTPKTDTPDTSKGSTIAPKTMTGTGTEDDPYVISNKDQFFDFVDTYSELKSISTYKYFRLDADIDLTGEEEFEPIGTSKVPFYGEFNGNGHKISNLKVTSYSKNISFYGLFGYALNSNIHDLDLTVDYDLNVYGSTTKIYVGGLLGAGDNTMISNVNVKGTMDLISSQNNGSSLYAGGIAGILEASNNYFISLSNCSSDVNINCDLDDAADTTNIIGGISAGVVTVTSHSNSSIGIYAIESSYYHGNITGGDVIGGIVGGLNSYVSITDCVAEGDSITAHGEDASYAGGILGQGYYESAVLNTYSNFKTISATSDNSTTYKPYAGSSIGFAYSSGYEELYDIDGTIVYSNYASNATVTSEKTGLNGSTLPSDKTLTEAVGLSSSWTYTNNTFSLAKKDSKTSTVTVSVDSNYSDTTGNTTVSFKKGGYDATGITTLNNTKFTRDHYCYSGLYFDKDATQKYLFFIPFNSNTTLYAGYGEYAKLVGTYNYVCSSSGSSNTVTGTWFFDEEYFYWESDYEITKYTYTFDGTYIFLDSTNSGGYAGEMFKLDSEGKIHGYDINDSDYEYVATKTDDDFVIPDYTGKSYLGTWYVSNGAVITLNADGNASGITTSSTVAYYGGYRETSLNTLDIKVYARLTATLTYDSTNAIMYGTNTTYGTKYFGARSAITKTYSSTDSLLDIYVVGDQNYAIYNGGYTTFTGTLTDGNEIVVGEDTYTVSGTTLTKKEVVVPSYDINGTYTDKNSNTMVLNSNGTGTWNNIDFTYTYDSTTKKGTLSTFGDFDGDSNSFTVNDDGTITVSVSDSYNENSYTGSFTKKTDDVTPTPSTSIEGTYTDSNKNTMVLGANGKGSWNGTEFSYTYDSTTKKGTISAFGAFDSESNSFTVNDDGTITVSIDDEYGENPYTGKMTKQASTSGDDSSSTTPNYVGSYTCKAPYSTISFTLNADGTGTWSGTTFTYTVKDSKITFSCGDSDYTLTLDSDGNITGGSFEYDYETFNISDIVKA